MKKIINIQNLICLVAFSAPLYLVKLNFGIIPTNVLEILIYILFIYFIFTKKHIGFRNIFNQYKIYILGIALVFLGLFFSTAVNSNWQDGLGIIKGWFFDPLLLAFVIIVSLKNFREADNILKALYFSAFAVSLISLYYFLSGYLTYDLRLKAFYLSPNYLAMFLAPAVIIGIYLIRQSLEKRKAASASLIFSVFLIYPIALLAIITTLFLTYSYATWIALILALITTLFIQKKGKIILITLAIFSAFIATQISNPKLSELNSPRSSLESRIAIWHSASRILKDHPIFGIGPGNFQNKYLEYQKYFPPYLEWAVPQPHNIYLAFWLQSGIMGIFGFLLIIIFWLKNIIIEIRNQKNSYFLLAAALFSIILYILIHGLADTPYWKNDLSVIFWIIFSLGLYHTASRQSD